MKYIISTINILLMISTDAACQRSWKVGDSVDLSALKVAAQMKISRLIGKRAPDYRCTLPSGRVLTTANTIGYVQFFVVWEPFTRNQEMLPGGRPATTLCPLVELARKDTSLIITSVMTDTSGLASKNRPCAAGAIPYALTTETFRRNLTFGLGCPMIIVIGKDGTVANIVSGFELLLDYNDDLFAELIASTKKLLE